MLSHVIRRVAVVGGTHGNELTGVYLIKKFQQFPDLLKRSTFETVALLANPKAVALNRRYVDRDLNRCFGRADLANPDLTGYEDTRAKEIWAQLCPKDQNKADFIIDIHSTTANMGLTILPSSKHPFNLQLLAYLSELDPSVRVFFREDDGEDAPMLRSLSTFGCTIEVGPIAHGVVNAHLFEQTERLVRTIVDYLDATNLGNPPVIPSYLTAYQAIVSVDYPRNAVGEIQATIHPQLQFKDYEPLHPGEPMFLTFTGELLPYQGESTVFPVFINEAAYYEKHIAMLLTKKQQLQLETA
ncbi:MULTISPECIES: aspartoacylase [unclassified Microcoleus]|uniref:aspartoacylase n=1 Tax=unclassified Microcoleus TaxID=2642155 RepID=UPI0025E7570C|nr:MULTISPECIES: aspartoacylase [unclassified Microcoleus]